MKAKSHVMEPDVRCNKPDEKSQGSTTDTGTSDPPPRPPGGAGGDPPPATKSSIVDGKEK